MKHYYVLVLVGTLSCQKNQSAQTDSQVGAAISRASVIESATVAADTPGSSFSNFLIIPGEQVGAIRSDATEISLIALLGSKNVRHDTIYVGEGTYEIGTTIFKNTADQAHVLWVDKRRFARPESVLIRPARDENGDLLPGAGKATQWATNTGLTVGTSLREVEKRNGKPFSIYGFEWDYGGLSAGWRGGSLAEKNGTTYLSVGFAVVDELPNSKQKLYESVLGDQEFLSSTAALQTLNPTIQTLTILFK